MQLTITGQTPSKKNSKQLFIRGGVPTMVSSKNYLAWERDALWQLKGVTPMTDFPTQLSLYFFFKDLRRRDLDNCVSSVCDALVKSGVIPDDDVLHLRSVVAYYVGLDKANPRVLCYFSKPRFLSSVLIDTSAPSANVSGHNGEKPAGS